MKQLDLQLQEPPRRARASALRSFHISSPGGHVSVPEALEGERKAQQQEKAILELFRIHEIASIPPRWTPSDVHSYPLFRHWPLTSIRRALTNLTKRGLLQHHKADRRPGPYGAKESTWSLA